MNHRRRGKILSLITIIIILVSILYAFFLGPLISFLKNALPDDPVDIDPVLSPGDPVIDLSDYLKPSPSPSPTPNTTNDITSSSTGTVSPSPTPTEDPMIYKPDPKVPGVKQISGKNVRLEENTVNILMLGVDKQANIDSIFITSINEANKTIKVISVPRDTYVPYPSSIANVLKQSKYYFKGAFKVNAAAYVGSQVINYQDGKFANKGINFLCSVLDGLLVNTKVDIDDYIRVNFEGFTELVDIAGGVYVEVPENMYSSSGKLNFPKGRQFMNSKQALEFVRIRNRYDSEGNMVSSTGDPYRKANQLAFLRGCAEQLITIESANNSQKILESLSKNVYHSINSLSKLSKYSSIAADYAKGNYEMELLLIVGKSIDPLGDRASYVDIIS